MEYSSERNKILYQKQIFACSRAGYYKLAVKTAFSGLVSILLCGTVIFAYEAGENRNFTVTGYYSPVVGQSFYITGSYEGDIHLNGHGIHGADGTPVFPGMIAAPADYAFGTKICLENFGCGEVHDRGGAIVNQGKRDLARHDRLDLWLGYGEEGLFRALDLGVWEAKGELFSADRKDITVAVNFKAITPLASFLDLPAVKIFDTNLYFGIVSEKVKELQTALQSLGYYLGEINGIYGTELKNSVLDFQVQNLVIANENSEGAGNFGPQTRSALSETIYYQDLQEKMIKKWELFRFEDDFSLGIRNALVWKLQEILIKLEYLDSAPTGYFGKMTQKAVIGFQLENGIISTESDSGAGRIGPKTREYLNLVLEKEQQKIDQDQIAYQGFLHQKNQLRFLAGEISDIFSNHLIVKK